MNQLNIPWEVIKNAESYVSTITKNKLYLRTICQVRSFNWLLGKPGITGYDKMGCQVSKEEYKIKHIICRKIT